MALRDELISVEETAHVLHVSVQHVRRLIDRGELTGVARGQIDRVTLNRYLNEQRRGRTRSWAEHTAWGAIAFLSGDEAPWLGPTQASRVRRTLRGLTEFGELIVRTRDRARAHHFNAHNSALPLLRERIIKADVARLGLADSGHELDIDGYLATADLEPTIRTFALTPVGTGNVTLRVTAFDFSVVSRLVARSAVVATLDAATSVDPRARGAGERALSDMLRRYR